MAKKKKTVKKKPVLVKRRAKKGRAKKNEKESSTTPVDEAFESETFEDYELHTHDDFGTDNIF